MAKQWVMKSPVRRVKLKLICTARSGSSCFHNYEKIVQWKMWSINNFMKGALLLSIKIKYTNICDYLWCWSERNIKNEEKLLLYYLRSCRISSSSVYIFSLKTLIVWLWHWELSIVCPKHDGKNPLTFKMQELDRYTTKMKNNT